MGCNGKRRLSLDVGSTTQQHAEYDIIYHPTTVKNIRTFLVLRRFMSRAERNTMWKFPTAYKWSN